MMTITGKMVMKKLMNSTIVGVRATPWLMLKILAVRNRSTSANNADIW